MTNVCRTLRTQVSRQTCKEEIHDIKHMADLEVIQVKKTEERLMKSEEEEAANESSKSLMNDSNLCQKDVPWQDKQPWLEDKCEWQPKKESDAEEFDKSEPNEDQTSEFAVRFIKNLQDNVSHTYTPTGGELQPEELEGAEKFCVRRAQQDELHEEREQLQQAMTTGTQSRKT